MKLLHISDLHDSMVDLSVFPDHHVIVTGDITNDGREGQFLAAHDALRGHKGGLSLVPGNHDYGWQGNLYSRESARRFDEILSAPLQGHCFADKVPLVRKFDGVTLIGLNSNLETSSPFDFACGEIGQAQSQLLDDALAGNGGVKIIALHHHPFMHSDATMKLVDAQAFWRVVEGRADVVLFGHKHESDRWSGRYGIPHVLAADNSPVSGFAREILLEGGNITINTVKVRQTQ